MNQVVKKLLVAKLGAGLVTSLMAYRKKNKAIDSIEQSEFYKIMQRLIHHPKTRRRDGFYKIRYQFLESFGESSTLEATAEKYRPDDDIAVNDSLEISLHSETEEIHIRQSIKSKPLLEMKKLPNFLQRGLFSVFHVENSGSKIDIERATKTLDRILGVQEDTTFYLEAKKT